MAKSIKALVSATVLIVLPLLPAWGQEEPATASKKTMSIVGTYQVVSIERDGQRVPEDHYRGDTVQITKDKITTYDMDKKEILVVTYKIDSSTTPCRITTVSELPIKDMKSSGLIECDGGTLRLICAMPGGQMPTAFKTGSNQQMFVLKSQSR